LKRFNIPIYILLILLFVFPSVCTEGARNGLLLWFNTVIPSIFPFIMMTSLLGAFGGIRYIEKLFGPLISLVFGCSVHGAYAVITGFLCGYPLGAKACADSYRMGFIDRHEAGYLLTFCSNPGPVYLYNYVLCASLDCPGLAPVFFLSVYAGAWLTARVWHFFIYRRFCPLSQKRKLHIQDFSPAALMEQTMMDALSTIQKIGIYIILFSIFSSLIFLLPDTLNSVRIILTGVCEQTTGIHALCLSSVSFQTKIVLTGVFASFGGLAVAAQTYGIISSHGLSLKPYFIGKATHALFTGSILCLWLRFF